MLTRIAFRLLVSGGDGTGGNPVAQPGNLRFVKRFTLGRHPLVQAGGGNFLEQQAFGGLAGDDGRAVLAALADELRRVQPQFRLLLERAVAGVTARHKDRLHVLEIIHGPSGLSGESEADEHNQSDAEHGGSDARRPGFIVRTLAVYLRATDLVCPDFAAS